LLDGLAIMLLRGFPLGAPEGLRHFDESVLFGLGHQSCEGEQLAALFLREVGEKRSIRFDRLQYSYARAQVVFRNVHPGIIAKAPVTGRCCCGKGARAGWSSNSRSRHDPENGLRRIRTSARRLRRRIG
jgi:hypothetical protein